MGFRESVIKIRDRLAPVKDIVAIIVFFGGGVVFVLSYFVAKSTFDDEVRRVNVEILEANERLTREVASLQCKLLSHVNILSFNDVQNKILSLRPSILEQYAPVELRITSGVATPEDFRAAREFEETLKEYERDLISQKKKHDDAWDNVMSGGC